METTKEKNNLNIGTEDEFGSYCQYWSMKSGVFCNRLTGEYHEPVKMSSLKPSNPGPYSFTNKEQEKLFWFSSFFTSFIEIFYWFKTNDINLDKVVVGTSGWKLLQKFVFGPKFNEKNKFLGVFEIEDWTIDPTTNEPIRIVKELTVHYEPHFNIDYMLFGDRDIGKTVLVKLLHSEELYV